MSEEPQNTATPDGTPSMRTRFVNFLWRTKKFWLPPIILAALLLALLYYLAGERDVSAPFVYGV